MENSDMYIVELLNIMWCFDRKKEQVKLILKKGDRLSLPVTKLLQTEDANAAIVRFTAQLTDQNISDNNIKQLEVITDPACLHDNDRVITLVTLTYLPTLPQLMSDDLTLVTLGIVEGEYALLRDDNAPPIILNEFTSSIGLPKELATLLVRACEHVKQELELEPNILRILGQSFTLREARSVYAHFLKTEVNDIDNSNFKKTHQKFFEEVGKATQKGPGRPASLYVLKS